MDTLKPLPPPGPPNSGRTLGIVLAVNIALLLLLNMLSQVAERGGVAVVLVFLQLFVNLVFMLMAFLNGEKGWGAGFLLSGLLVLLVGVGMCGRQL